MRTDQDTALITGCSSGIGRATALTFREHGWRVYATARDTDDIEALADEGCETVPLDVTKERDVRHAVDRVIDEAGRLDCLVNNAGYAQFGAVEDVPLSALHRQFDVNVYGPYRLIREALPHMRERGDGTIINVSSVAGRIAHPLGGAYSGSKYAIEGISDSLRSEVSDHGIDVVLVEPGPVDSEFYERAVSEADEIARSEAYDSLYTILDDAEAIGGGSLFAVAPEAVGYAIVDAASSLDPPARKPVGLPAKLWLKTRFLPDAWRDLGYRLFVKFVSRDRLRRS